MSKVSTAEFGLLEAENAHASGGVQRRAGVVIIRGEGIRLFDDRGNAYVDCGSAHGWANLGHNHPDVTRAIQEQAKQLVALTESAYNDQRAAWLEELANLFTREIGSSERGALCRILPCNSGAEAIEAAIKVSRLFTGRSQFVAFRRGFHGRTLGALSATANLKFRQPFEPLVPGFTHVPFNDIDRLDRVVNDSVAGVLVETVQGEGGVHPATDEFLRALRSVCTARGALLIVDEIQTGFGRTGRWFACQHSGVAPDIIAMGKSLGGGIPMGAIAWRSDLGTIPSGSHGSTFGGGPLACAASRAMLDALDRGNVIEDAARLGQLAQDYLEAFDAFIVRDVRGLGLMIGVEVKTRVGPLLKRLMERGVWALPAGLNVLRIMPPLIIKEAELQSVLQIIGDTLLEGDRA